MWNRIAAAVGGLAFGIAVVVGVELLLRAAGVAEGATPRDPFSGFSSAVSFFEPAQRADGTPIYQVSAMRVGRKADAPVERQRQFLADPPPDLFRIFLIGGSTTQGVPYSTDLAFSGWLERRLEAALPELSIEVVNAAMAGYGSRRELTVVEEIAAYQPDLLVVHTGHNEWAERSFYARFANMDPRLFRLLEFVYGTRIYALASAALDATGVGATGQLLDMDPKRLGNEYFAVGRDTVQGRIFPSPEEIRTRDRLYERHLRLMARMMRAAGARVVFLTLGQNLADWPPAASTHRPDLSQADRAAWDAHVAEGDRLVEAGDCPGALAAFARALALDDQYAELHFRVAGCERRLGRLPAALEHYRLASDLDRVPHGVPRSFNEIVRRVAGEEGGVFVDVEAGLSELSPGGLLGDDLFVDFAHLNIRGNQRVAEVVASALREAGIPLPAERWREGAWQDPDPALLYTAHPELRALELRSRLFVCLVAPRPACPDEARALLALEPESGLARQVLGQATAAVQSDAAPAELP